MPDLFGTGPLFSDAVATLTRSSTFTVTVFDVTVCGVELPAGVYVALAVLAIAVPAAVPAA